MEGNGRAVDLSLAQPGDECERRDGERRPFNGPIRSREIAKAYKFDVGGDYYCPSGNYWSDDAIATLSVPATDPRDILRVTRNGVQITPAPEPEKQYPNAGPNRNLGLYRTGEKPEVGDRIAAHGEKIHGTDMELNGEYTVRSTDHTAGFVVTTTGRDVYAARFDLISRATPAPSAPEARGAEEKCDECGGKGKVEYMTIVGERLTDCPKCQSQDAPGGAEVKAADSTEPEAVHAKGCVEQEASGAVITGPGKYRTVRFDETGEQRHLADVEAFGNGRWYGSVAVPDLAYAWTPDGNCVANEKVCITGPYVPPPEPKYRPFTPEEALQHVGREILWRTEKTSDTTIHGVGKVNGVWSALYGDGLSHDPLDMLCEAYRFADDGKPCGVPVTA